MDAGRELDALIALHVIGWRRLPTTNWPAWGFPPGVALVHGNECELPHYSTDIADAWQLIEHHPHYVYLIRSIDGGRFGWEETPTWKCRFYAPEKFEVRADTAPLAICLAALKTVDVSND